MQNNQLKHQLLWEKIVLNNKDGFLDLYKELYYKLVNHGIKMCNDADLAAEAVDDVFVYIWDKRATLSRVENVEAYLITSIRRRILRLLNKKKKADIALKNSFTLNDWFDEGYESFIIQMQTDELLKKRLKIALDKLTYRQKQLIYLKFFEENSYEEIAQKTNQTIKTAYNTIYDALKILRKFLKK
ncbi:RNA polymerase sigma factor [Sphingobacterium composti Ten et al. 2007 non Yoo et al. 2007]|uniref:RNA polymerase sigma factor n=1 Tax=Sphingobacterium composti TaxID=363260 RepID=UPI00135C75A8|nr:sigma-70 family RNA polymerase sigma factor [Sphingobacterium composti Ten et al. 2007 non Yoo et al. 2007]